jgi:2-haloacid dehalogenase
MSAPRKAILFDFGNVLVKWDLHTVFDRFFPDPEAVDAFLAEVSFLQWNALQDKGRPFREGLAAISEQFPHYAHLFQYLDRHWSDSIREPIPGTVALAEKLKAAGYPLYILTNSSAEKFPLARQIHPFLAMFDDILVSGEIGMLKPDPAIFHYTLSRIHRTAEECIFIDDHLPNVEAAQGLGFNVIHFQSPGQLERQLKNLVLWESL